MTNQSNQALSIQSIDQIERSFDPVSTAEELRQRLSRDPFKTEYDEFTKSYYVPISTLEWTMDWVFGPACWGITESVIEEKGKIGQTKDGSIMIGFTCTVKVQAIHPILNVTTTMIGIASGSYTYGRFKTAFSALQALAFKNACKKWGKIFGRDLNRKLKEILSDQFSKAAIIQTWIAQEVNTLPKLAKAQKFAQKKYGKGFDLTAISEAYKKDYIDEKK